jgi:phosphopantothenoylcysteine decarboxylase/phosphopantothenate--cysteine ligase
MKTILLLITGSIAAYKTPDLVRQFRKTGVRVIPVVTKGGAQFVAPLALQAVAEEQVYGELFSLTDEAKMGHINLSRVSDAVLVAPASADFIAKMAYGLADDLASTAILAADKPVFIAPAMNPKMWQAKATQDNVAMLRQRGVRVIGPDNGMAACGEDGEGRMAEPAAIVRTLTDFLDVEGSGVLAGRHALVTAGPTYEAIDPVRFIGNHSSGKQGVAIAEALALAGAKVTLVLGPSAVIPSPLVEQVVRVTSAGEMQKAVEKALPADVAVFAAAVADWRVAKPAGDKLKKEKGAPALHFTANPDILMQVAGRKNGRPKLVIGFAAETRDVVKAAKEKRRRKGADWLIANDVSKDVFGSGSNTVHFITEKKTAAWPRMSKQAVAEKLVERIVDYFEE